MTSTALVTGVAGQDGMYVARLLLARGWSVVGTVRPGSSTLDGMRPYLEGVDVVEHDQRDAVGFARLLRELRPATVVNLAGLSSVPRSWSAPAEVMETNATAVVAMLDAIVRERDASGLDPSFVQASSSAMFGAGTGGLLAEDAAHDPRTPYAVSKSAAHHAVGAYRGEHGVRASSAILFGHESPFRGVRFVAGRVVRLAVETEAGRGGSIVLGDLDAQRDWAAAADVAEALVAMAEHEGPGDLVVATGRGHTVGDLLSAAFAAVGRDDWRDHVDLRPELWSPGQLEVLVGDPSRAAEVLGWRARTSFEELVAQMVDVDRRRLATGIAASAAYL